MDGDLPSSPYGLRRGEGLVARRSLAPKRSGEGAHLVGESLPRRAAEVDRDEPTNDHVAVIAQGRATLVFKHEGGGLHGCRGLIVCTPA